MCWIWYIYVILFYKENYFTAKSSSKDMITYEQTYLFSYLHKLGLAQDRCGMKVDFLLPVAGKQGGLLIDIDQVWIHACHQGCLHHSPVLRVQIDITDITAPTGTDKTWGRNSMFQVLVYIYLFIWEKTFKLSLTAFSANFSQDGLWYLYFYIIGLWQILQMTFARWGWFIPHIWWWEIGIKMIALLTNSTELSQQLRPHAEYHVHGGLGQEVLLTEGPLPALAAGFLPCLTQHRANMRENILNISVKS